MPTKKTKLIPVSQNGVVIYIHPDTLEQHLARGWRRVPANPSEKRKEDHPVK